MRERQMNTRSKMSKLKIYYHIVIRKLIKWILIGCFMCYIEAIAASLGLFERVNVNIIGVTVRGVLFFETGLALVFSCYVLFNKRIEQVDLVFKKYYRALVLGILVVEVLELYKIGFWNSEACNEMSKYSFCYMVIIALNIILLLIVELISVRQYKHSFGLNQRQYSCFVEKPVVGREKLTEKQKSTLDILKDFIDERKKSDSLNLAFQSEWGRGKTSITETLIDELEREDNYFILRISLLTMLETENLVEYVKNYFNSLFKTFSIGYGSISTSFWISIEKYLDDKENGWIYPLLRKGELFVDVEKQKDYFSKCVSDLLDRADKKNILLFVEDADRGVEWNKVKNLLLEIGSVNGIISIISLNDETWYKQDDKDKGKYMHHVIKMSEADFLLEDINITKQIVEAYNSIRVGRNEVELGAPDKSSLNDYSFMFLELLRKNGVTIYEGVNWEIEKYLESKNINIKEVYRNGYIDDFTWNTRLYQGKKSYCVSGMIADLEKVLFASVMQIRKLDVILNRSKNGIRNYEWICKGSDLEKLIYGSEVNMMPAMKEFIWKEDEFKRFVSMFECGEGDKINDFIKNKRKELYTMYIKTIEWMDFEFSLIEMLNNYRGLKQRLREADSYDMDLLEYLLKKYSRSEALNNFIEARNKEWIGFSNVVRPKERLFELYNKVLYQNHIITPINKKGLGFGSLKTVIDTDGDMLLEIKAKDSEENNAITLDCMCNILGM